MFYVTAEILKNGQDRRRYLDDVHKRIAKRCKNVNLVEKSDKLYYNNNISPLINIIKIKISRSNGFCYGCVLHWNLFDGFLCVSI